MDHLQARQQAAAHLQARLAAEAAAAAARASLRQQVAAGARPLPMSGWEDLVEAAAGDLERLEGQGHAAGAFLAEQQVGGACRGVGVFCIECVGRQHHLPLRCMYLWLLTPDGTHLFVLACTCTSR